MKVVAVTTVTTPYVTARYRRFSELYPRRELTLLELGRISNEYPWSPSEMEVPFNRYVLSDDPFEMQGRYARLRRIKDALNALQPDVLVVCGYGVMGMGAAIHWARSQTKRRPVVLLSDSKADDGARRPWKEYLKRRVIRQCMSALVAGSLHRRYMSDLGMPEEKIFEGYDVVDNSHFDLSTSPRGVGEPGPCPVDGGQYFLACSRFLANKNLLFVLDAYAKYRAFASGSKWNLAVLGDGKLRANIENKIETLGLRQYVQLLGFRQYQELPLIYAMAGAFVHASTTEQWGLVVNEAMASGLPVIISERCGCAPELVQSGVNGYTFDPYNVDALAERMCVVASESCDRAAMGRASRAIIESWPLEKFACALGSAIDAAMAARSSAPNFLDKILLGGLAWR